MADSTTNNAKVEDGSGKSATERPVNNHRSGPGQAVPAMEKPKNFKQSIGRMVKLIIADKVRATLLIVLLIASAVLASLGPKVLGNATNILFDGLVSHQVTQAIYCNSPENVTLDQLKSQLGNNDGYLDMDKLEKMMSQSNGQQSNHGTSMTFESNSSDSGKRILQQEIEQSDDRLRYETTGASLAKPGCETAKMSADSEFSGQNADLSNIKDMLSSMNITLGGSVDFELLAVALWWVIIVYLLTFLLRWIAGWISVRLISEASKKLRRQIEDKIWRLPLSYFDKSSRGDIMSRTTNDLDNVTQTLNQTGGDLVYMVLMVLSVIVMMFYTSWLLALITLVTVPVMFILVGAIMKVSGKAFREQWQKTGAVN
jgi:ABC-type multidrug transport system fused ATPase/permease subunit